MKRLSPTLWLLAAYALFVVYGSLVPLEFRALPWAQAWQRFQHIPFLKLGLESRADWVANGVLYAPLAFFACRAAVERGWAHALAVPLATLLCCLLAIGVEFTQLFFPARTVSQNDILAECLGSAVGACGAPFLAGWLDRLAQAWRGGGVRVLPRLLELYAAVYVLLCFFPYDLLLSQAEITGKWHSNAWGWVLAAQDRGPFLVSLQLLVEVVIAMPLGAWGRFQPGRRLWAPMTVGLCLGLGIEVGQFFVSSGVSQGASVLSRGVGVAVGAALLPWVRVAGGAGLRAMLRPWLLPLWVAYLLLLVAVNGAFKHSWHGFEGASGSWQTTHLLPFYYHYFTSEALALFSLGSVALMYLPVAALAWVGERSLRWTTLSTVLLVLAVEAGKLFVNDLHADPTNVLVAVLTNLGATTALAMVQRLPVPHAVTHAAPHATPVVLGLDATMPSASWAWLLPLPPVALAAIFFPAFPMLLLALLLLAAALVWRWPVLALALVPAALPVLDWAPWSGRFYLDEFDLLQATCLAVAFHRTPAGPVRPPVRPMTLAFVLLGVSLALASLRALWPLAWPDDNSFSSYLSPYNALRIVKGALWAWLFVGLWQRLDAAGPQRAQRFGAGMAAGLTLTVLFVLWERTVFASLLDFGADYRVTGPFSAMHKGGAYIECYLAVASAFVLAAVLRSGPAWLRLGALVLLIAAGYAVMVTYSRNGYAALAAVVLASLLPLVAAWRARARPAWVAPAVVLVLLAAVAWPVASGSYARQRLAKSGADLAVRQAHWADGLALRDNSLATALFGMGLGRFPQAHYWRSAEPVHAASYGLVREGGTPFLRLAQGATLYIEQTLPWPASTDSALQLSLDWRAAPSAGPLVVMLCEKWTLTSRACVQAGAAAAPALAGGSGPANTDAWRHADLALDLSKLQSAAPPWRAPLKLAVLTPAQGALDVRRVGLRTAQGVELLVNGDFAQGMDHWFFATDVDPPWHLHSLPVAVLFDQGWMGVLAWAAVLLGAGQVGARLLWRGQAQVLAAWAAVLSFWVSGTLNTLIDAPRFLWLLLVLLWMASLAVPKHRQGAL